MEQNYVTVTLCIRRARQHSSLHATVVKRCDATIRSFGGEFRRSLSASTAMTTRRRTTQTCCCCCYCCCNWTTGVVGVSTRRRSVPPWSPRRTRRPVRRRSAPSTPRSRERPPSSPSSLPPRAPPSSPGRPPSPGPGVSHARRQWPLCEANTPSRQNIGRKTEPNALHTIRYAILTCARKPT